MLNYEKLLSVIGNYDELLKIKLIYEKLRRIMINKSELLIPIGERVRKKEFIEIISKLSFILKF